MSRCRDFWETHKFDKNPSGPVEIVEPGNPEWKQQGAWGRGERIQKSLANTW